MKISVVVTVLNESKSIYWLLVGLLNQTLPAAEVIIVDALSTDVTVPLIKAFQQKYPDFPVRVVVKKGNRSAGRNFGIKLAKNQWVAITDAGCMPQADWLEQLAFTAMQTKAEVIAGYYEAEPLTPFEEAVVPYMLVMPDRVNPNYFLPATRSMMLTKKSWQQVGGFDEQLTLSEDYDFAHKLAQAGFTMAFAQAAVVTWWPLSSLGEFYQTVRGMAEYDARAGIARIKSYLVIFRYALLLFICSIFLGVNDGLCVGLILLISIMYSAWAIMKNAQYLDHGWYYLPILQLVADAGVIVGTTTGLFKRIK